MARLHKKEMQLCKLYLRFAFKPHSYDKTKKPHISFICFRNVAFQIARCVNMNAMEDKENEEDVEDAALIQTLSFRKLS